MHHYCICSTFTNQRKTRLSHPGPSAVYQKEKNKLKCSWDCNVSPLNQVASSVLKDRWGAVVKIGTYVPVTHQKLAWLVPVYQKIDGLKGARVSVVFGKPSHEQGGGSGTALQTGPQEVSPLFRHWDWSLWPIKKENRIKRLELKKLLGWCWDVFKR